MEADETLGLSFSLNGLQIIGKWYLRIQGNIGFKDEAGCKFERMDGAGSIR